MGCDIHSHTEIHENGVWKDVEFYPFDWRSYGMFGFLANVRNYSHVPYISAPRGLPEGVCQDTREMYEDHDYHSFSWLMLDELLNRDYDLPFEDRRTTREESPGFFNGAALAEVGQGRMVTYREFLGEKFFADIEKLKEFGDPKNVRVVFYFDN